MLATVMAATALDRKLTIDSLRRVLPTKLTASDSVRVLYDIFDLSEKNQLWDVGNTIYDVAGRAGDSETQLDMLRQLTNVYYGNDSVQAIMQARAEKFPESTDRSETLTFIRLMRTVTASRKASDEQCRQRMNQLLKSYTSDNEHDPYEQIEMLFSICSYMKNFTQGDLLLKYMTELEGKIKALPSTSMALRNAFYTQAANTLVLNERYEAAVKANKEILKILNELTQRYHAKGRKFRQYDRIYYLTYRRLLSNYKALTPDEIEEYYTKFKHYATTSPAHIEDYNNTRRADIYYAMATRDYPKAIELIKAHIDKPSNKAYRRVMLKSLKDAATAIGDKETLLQATLSYNDILEEYMKSKSDEQFRELEIVYDIDRLKSRQAQLELEKSETYIESQRVRIVITVIAIVVLAVFLFILLYMYRHTRALSRNLADANRLLRDERDNLKKTRDDLIAARDRAHSADRQKTEFINNMSHEVREPLNAIVGFSQLIIDSIDDSKRKYFERYAKIIELNADLLRTLVNDVLDVAAIENSTMHINPDNVSVMSVCNIAADGIRPRLKPGVDLTVTLAAGIDELTTIHTDPRRVEQVLHNLLSNATKFTEEGRIDLSCEINEDEGTVTFAVSDTGPGIPEGKEEQIFARFEKLDNYTQGVGLGLHVCRLVARLLGGDVKVDTAYRNGARFTFTIPAQR